MRLTVVIVYKVRILNKDSLHMFSKILKQKKIDHALNTNYFWAIIKIFILSKYCNGQKDKEDVL